MTPKGIVEKAAALGINIIAVCDHNSMENVEVTRDVAKGKGIYAIAGMEINSAEEVHILGLFGDSEAARRMQEVVYLNLQPGENDEDAIGMQVIVNADDEVLEFNRRLLIGATGLSVNDIVGKIHSLGGIAVASHIDREGFGIIAQLGFIDPDAGFDALEISSRLTFDKAESEYGMYRHIPWISSSDAHLIEDIGRRTSRFIITHATFDEIRLALKDTGRQRVYF